MAWLWHDRVNRVTATRVDSGGDFLDFLDPVHTNTVIKATMSIKISPPSS